MRPGTAKRLAYLQNSLAVAERTPIVRTNPEYNPPSREGSNIARASRIRHIESSIDHVLRTGERE